MDLRKRIEEAVLKNSKKHLPKEKRKKKNKDPEAQEVLKIMAVGRKLGFDLEIIDASNKGVKHRYTGVKSGYSDISGDDKNGYAVYIEAKAPGKRSTLKANQYKFLKRKLMHGCFAISTDDHSKIEDIYFNWLNLKQMGQEKAAKEYLYGLLYVPKSIRDDLKNKDLF